jgi:Zn-dependent M16 (insulinase) family peptidase
MRFSLKTLDDQIEAALGVLRDLLFAVDPRDPPRLRDVVTQALTSYRSDFVYEGHGTAIRRAARGLSPIQHLGYVVHGLPQLEQCEGLHARFDEESAALMGRIEAIREFLLVRGRLTASFTGSDRAFAAVRRALTEWSAALRVAPVEAEAIRFEPFAGPPREGLAAPIDVAYCAQSFPAPHYSHPDEPLLVLGARMVGADYILSEIRFKGNAYGASFRYDPLGGCMTLSSYRDPHVVQTLRVFEGVRAYVQQADWQPVDVDRAIIGSAKDDERPIRPGEATGLALQRYLIGLTPALRAERLQRLRGATPAEVKRALLAVLEANLARGAVCVVASRERLEQANEQLGGAALTVKDILKR